MVFCLLIEFFFQYFIEMLYLGGNSGFFFYRKSLCFNLLNFFISFKYTFYIFRHQFINTLLPFDCEHSLLKWHNLHSLISLKSGTKRLTKWSKGFNECYPSETASGRLDVGIPTRTDLSRKNMCYQLHLQTLSNGCECHGFSQMTITDGCHLPQ